MTKFINANPASRSRWPPPSCRSPTTSAMGKIIWMLGFSSRANRRNSCTARCWSIWYRLFIATLSFFLAEKLPSVIMTGVESRYFLRTNGHPLIGVASYGSVKESAISGPGKRVRCRGFLKYLVGLGQFHPHPMQLGKHEKGHYQHNASRNQFSELGNRRRRIPIEDCPCAHD